MKVAVCVGGLVYPDSDVLMDQLQSRFPDYDFFFGVWRGRENDLTDKLGAWSFDEHEPMYHPFFDVDIPGMSSEIAVIRQKMKDNPEMPMIDKAWHQTKQILLHSHMLDLLPPEYDMIVRARYDIKLIDDNSIDFDGLIARSYENNHAIGLANCLAWFPNKAKRPPKMFNPKGTSSHRLWEQYLMDLIVIHPRRLFDKELMLSLHGEQKLLAGEFGWHQVLSQPYGDTHQNYMCDVGITSRGDA